MQTTTLQERALKRLWELFEEGDEGNALCVLNMFAEDVRSGRLDQVAEDVQREKWRAMLASPDSPKES